MERIKKRIKLGGKNRVFTFGLLFTSRLLKRFDLTFDKLFETVGGDLLTYAPALLFESLCNTYDDEKKEIDFTESDILNWLNNEPFNGFNVIAEFEVAWMESFNNTLPIDDKKKEGSKKK